MSVSDDIVANVIIEKLNKSVAVVPFAEIARAARDIGRNRLAALVCTCHFNYIAINFQFFL